MADQKIIIVVEGSVNPSNIVLGTLTLPDAATLSLSYLYSVTGQLKTGDPSLITCRPYAASPTDIELYPLADYLKIAPLVDIILTNPNEASEGEPPISYYAILKRWTGSAWTKAELKAYFGGSWQVKAMKCWTGTEWGLVDTTGI